MIASILLFLNNFFQQDVEMADQMRSDGKIWVVVAVIAVVLVGILVYLFLLDKKISKLEKEI